MADDEGEDEDAVDLNINEVSRAFGIPWPLVKASVDPFDYAVGLRDGTVIRFEHCEFDAEHVLVTLKGITAHSFAIPRIPTHTGPEHAIVRPFTLPRGLVVRVVDILWAADAPNGS